MSLTIRLATLNSADPSRQRLPVLKASSHCRPDRTAKRNRHGRINPITKLHTTRTTVGVRLAMAGAVTGKAGTMSSTEWVTFENPKQEQLVGTLLDTGSSDVAVLCHGFSSTKDGAFLPDVAAALAEQGMSSLRFDFSGNGESEGTFQYGNNHSEVEDLRSAVSYLRSRGKNVRAILGHSKGGTCVILYAGKYDDVPLVVNVAGRFDCTQGITERFGADIFDRLRQQKQILVQARGFTWTLTEEDMKARLATDVAAAAREIRKSRVLTVHGTADATIPTADAQACAQAVPQHSLILMDSADHGFNNPQHRKELVAHVVKFMTASA